ncbi:MAG: hypothetical protein NVSMB42_02580 [Herpetosiphon sp.]
MPRLSCWFVRAALLHLAVGVLFGGLILRAKGVPSTFGWAWQLLPARIQLVVVGGLVQLTFGVAYWIVPRSLGSNVRGRSGWAWGSWSALNAGCVGSTLVVLLQQFLPNGAVNRLLLSGVLCEVLAIGMFSWHLWPRLAAFRRALPVQQP